MTRARHIPGCDNDEPSSRLWDPILHAIENTIADRIPQLNKVLNHPKEDLLVTLKKATSFFHGMHPGLRFLDEVSARENASRILIVICTLDGMGWRERLTGGGPMTNVDADKICIIGQEAEDVAFLAHCCREIETIGGRSMGRFVEGPFNVESGLTSPGRDTASTAEAIAKCITAGIAIREVNHWLTIKINDAISSIICFPERPRLTPPILTKKPGMEAMVGICIFKREVFNSSCIGRLGLL